MKISYLLIIAIAITTQSCVTFWAPRDQEINISLTDSTSRLYHFDSLLDSGRNANIELEKMYRAEQFKYETDGFKPEYYALLQSKRSAFFYVNIPFWIGLFPVFDNLSPKAHYYEDSINFKNKYKMVVRDSTLKRIKSRYITFNSNNNKSLFNANICDARYYRKGKDPIIMTEELELEEDSKLYFDKYLDEFLIETNFEDSLKSPFYDNINTLYVEAEIKEVNMNYYQRNYGTPQTPRFATCEMKIDWKLKDSYGSDLFEKELKSMSGEFTGKDVNSFEDLSAGFTKTAIKDVIQNSYLEFFDQDEFQKYIKHEEYNNDKETLYITRPSKIASRNGDAVKATISLSSEIDKNKLASGFFVNNDGYIVSSYRASLFDSLKATLSTGESFSVEVVRFDKKADLSLLKIDYQSEYALDFSNYVDESKIIGTQVNVIGTSKSLDLGQSVSQGIISASRKKFNFNWYQTDAKINSGNHGGPAIDKETIKLIGIVDYKLSGKGTESIGFLVPIGAIDSFLKLEYK